MADTQHSLYGRTSTGRSEATTVMIFGPSLKKSQTPVFQCLQAEDGLTPEWLEVAEGAQVSRGGNLMRKNVKLHISSLM